jgi:hypothetical protein
MPPRPRHRALAGAFVKNGQKEEAESTTVMPSKQSAKLSDGDPNSAFFQDANGPRRVAQETTGQRVTPARTSRVKQVRALRSSKVAAGQRGLPRQSPSSAGQVHRAEPTVELVETQEHEILPYGSWKPSIRRTSRVPAASKRPPMLTRSCNAAGVPAIGIVVALTQSHVAFQRNQPRTGWG